MSVSNQVTKNKYTLNGSTTTFSYTFDIATSDGSDIHLFLYNTASSVQTEITGFTVDTTAKTITWSGAASYGNTYTLTLTRETVLTQLLALVNEGNFYAEDIMAALDKLTYITQEQAEELERCVKTVLSSTTNPDELMALLASYVQTAEESATSAGSSASTATTKAAEAADSASTATTKAAEAADSAASASTYSRVRLSDTTYPLRAVVVAINLANNLYLQCITSGKTASIAPTGISSLAEGDTITDGGVVWKAITLAPLTSPAFLGTPTTQTPTQFDASTQLANGASVMAAAGASRGVITVTENYTLSAADNGNNIMVTTSGVTLTLPTIYSAAHFKIFNVTAAPIGIVSMDASKIYGQFGLNLSAVTLPAYSSIDVYSGGTIWYTHALARYSIGTLASTGYKVINPETGLLLQWGQSAAISPGGYLTVSFPTTFPNSSFPVQITPYLAGSFSLSGDNGPLVASAQTTSQFQVNSTDDANSYYANYYVLGY